MKLAPNSTLYIADNIYPNMPYPPVPLKTPVGRPKYRIFPRRIIK